MAKDGRTALDAGLLLDALADIFGVTYALCNDHDEVALAGLLCVADALDDVLFKVILHFRDERCDCTDSDAGVECDVAAAPAHDLYNAAAVMRLCGIADAVDHFHSGVHRRVITDGIFGARNIVIDGARNADARNACAGQVACAAERSVAADNNHAVDAQFATFSSCLLNALRGIELGAARRKERCAAVLDDVGNAAKLHFLHFAGQKTVVAVTYAICRHAEGDRGADNSTNRSIHARCVTAARKYCDFLCTHCKFLHFLIENCKVKNAIQQFIPFIFDYTPFP